MYVKDLVNALDVISNGRVLAGDKGPGTNPFVVTKTSHLPGKAVTETPGLVVGDPHGKIKKIAVLMTLTESAIELAGACGVDALVVHHPVADAASSGGVLLKTYLELYNLAVLELHEAFHGLHPGIAHLHGHDASYANIAYSHVPGNILFVGKALDGVKTLGDMLSRIAAFMDTATDEKLLQAEKEIRDCADIDETAVKARGKILLGNPEDTVRQVMHIFPHTGFTPDHMERAFREHPQVDTVLATISRVFPDHSLVDKARELGLNFICGNSHALEILENGLPLAHAIQALLPEAEVVIFKERMSAVPMGALGGEAIQNYAAAMAKDHLITRK